MLQGSSKMPYRFPYESYVPLERNAMRAPTAGCRVALAPSPRSPAVTGTQNVFADPLLLYERLKCFLSVLEVLLAFCRQRCLSLSSSMSMGMFIKRGYLFQEAYILPQHVDSPYNCL